MLAVTTTSLPGATVGVPYSATLTATGGTPSSSGTTNYVWASLGSPLPSGLTLARNGVISGTPTGLIPTSTAAVTTTVNSITTSSLIFQVSDGTSTARSQPLSLTVTRTNPPVTTNWWPWLVGAGVFIIFVIIVIVLVWYNQTPTESVELPVVEPLPAGPGPAYVQAGPTYVPPAVYSSPLPTQTVSYHYM